MNVSVGPDRVVHLFQVFATTWGLRLEVGA